MSKFNDFLNDKQKEKEAFKEEFKGIVESIEKKAKAKEEKKEVHREPEIVVEQVIPKPSFYNRANRYFNNDITPILHNSNSDVIVEKLKNDMDFISKVKPVSPMLYGATGGMTVQQTNQIIDERLANITVNVSGAYLENVVEDLTPQLGGDLDTQRFNISNLNSIRFHTSGTSATIPTTVGSLYWDLHDKTLSCILENSTLQIGQEQYIICVNRTSATILNGSVVYINGAQGNRPTIQLASCNEYETSCCVIGVATHDILVNAEGMITTTGLVRDLNTNSFSDGGKTVYLSSAAGQITASPPTLVSAATIAVGVIVKTHPTDGWLYVKIHQEKKEFGNVTSGNFTKFENDGTMVMYGDATVYEDVIGNILTARIESPASNIVLNMDNASLTFQNDCTSADYIIITCQNPHKWEIGSIIYPHIHWEQSTSAIPNWVLGYRWQVNGGQKTSNWTYLPIYNGPVFNRTSGTLNQITTFNIITPPVNASLSDMVQFKLIRDYTNQFNFYSGSETNGLNVELQAMDYHFRINRLGSHGEYIY